MIDLFAMTKIMFEKPNEWETVTKGDKKKHFFMAQRRFAIQFPMQANALQHLKINQVGVIDFWQIFMRQRYQRTPSWMFTKGINKTKAIKEKKTKVGESLIFEFSKQMKIDKKSIYDALEFYPDLMTKELLSFQKMINSNK